jgi:hypothetical protein
MVDDRFRACSISVSATGLFTSGSLRLDSDGPSDDRDDRGLGDASEWAAAGEGDSGECAARGVSRLLGCALVPLPRGEARAAALAAAARRSLASRRRCSFSMNRRASSNAPQNWSSVEKKPSGVCVAESCRERIGVPPPPRKRIEMETRG